MQHATSAKPCKLNFNCTSCASTLSQHESAWPKDFEVGTGQSVSDTMVNIVNPLCQIPVAVYAEFEHVNHLTQGVGCMWRARLAPLFARRQLRQ
jgi:hypothetical protein